MSTIVYFIIGVLVIYVFYWSGEQIIELIKRVLHDKKKEREKHKGKK